MAIQEITLECPFCHKGQVRIRHEEGMITFRATRSAAAGRKMIRFRTSDKYEVLGKCPNCGKSIKELQKAFDTGVTKELTHDERIKRLKEAGLPTVIESKR